MEDLYYISVKNQHGPVAGKHFGAEELVATPFNITRILLWTNAGPDPGAAAHYLLSSSETSPDFVLRQPCNGSLCAVNRMTEDLLQEHPPVWNEPTKQDLRSSNSSCSHPSAPYGILKTQLA